MCLPALAAGLNPRFPWVLASNRDEFFNRPAAPLAWWQPASGVEAVLGGRDLSAGGTWLALQRSGQLALVTNVREPGHHLADAPSRGDLVPLWLGSQAVREQPQSLLQPPRNGFNLLGADLACGGTALWVSNRGRAPVPLCTAVHGLSNAALDTAWPKVDRLKAGLAAEVSGATLTTDAALLTERSLALLADRSLAADADLPSTGVPLDRERALSAIFIRITEPGSPEALYGTRCSTVVVLEHLGHRRTVHVTERTVDTLGHTCGQVHESFDLEP